MKHRHRKCVLPLLSFLISPCLIECSTENQELKPRVRETKSHLLLPKQISGQQGCADDLFASDLNEDNAINQEEYTLFIGLRSDGEIVVDEYSDLPLSLISNFVYGACFCSIVSMTPNCCVGPAAAISLDVESSPLIPENLFTVCTNVDAAIANVIGTSAPTATLAPAATLTPTEPPTTPTMPPSVDESPQPSGVITLSPTTFSPTSSPSEETSRPSTPPLTPTSIPTNVTTEQPSEFPTLAPTAVPTLAPTPALTEAPTLVPTAAPTLLPTGAPTPALTEAPTLVPTAAPTLLPTGAPTPALTEAPTLVPTAAPTLLPTGAPTPALTEAPTLVPTAAPTFSPTGAPTPAQTEAPTLVPTAVPTFSPTAAPTLAPSLAPTVESPMPTPEALTCVTFQYGIENSGGFTAEDIFNEVNNTLKTGLIIATRNVTIEILNETFPRGDDSSSSQRFLRTESLQISKQYLATATSKDRADSPIYDINRPYHGRGMIANPSLPINHLFNVMDLGPFPSEASRSPQKDVNDLQRRRRTVYLPQEISHMDDDGRRLAYYSDAYPPVINSIADNPFCDKPSDIQCAVVDSTVCVILEEGDDEAAVQTALLLGISEAIRDGSFQAAIPSENQIPGEFVQ